MDGYPIIVTGTGRSGTSSIAKVCQSLGIFMGEHFRDPDDTNPDGFYEDLDFHMPLVEFTKREITEAECLERWHAASTQRVSRGQPWGFKSPLVLDHVDLAMRAFPGARFVIPIRPYGDVCASLSRCYGFSADEALAIHDSRLKAMQKLPEGKILVTWDKVMDGTSRRFLADKLGLKCQTRVLFHVPSMGWIHRTCMPAQIAAAVRAYATGVSLDFDWPEEGEYVQKMNRAAKMVVREHYDWLITMDDDNGPIRNPLDLIELDLPVVGLPTPIYKQTREWPFMYSAFDKVEGGYVMHDPAKGGFGVQEVDSIGSGCMVVRADVLRVVGLPAFVRVKDGDGIKTKLSPDHYFCNLVREAGFKIHAHFGYKCNHVKNLELGTLFEKVGNLIVQNREDVSVAKGEPA